MSSCNAVCADVTVGVVRKSLSVATLRLPFSSWQAPGLHISVIKHPVSLQQQLNSISTAIQAVYVLYCNSNIFCRPHTTHPTRFYTLQQAYPNNVSNSINDDDRHRGAAGRNGADDASSSTDRLCVCACCCHKQRQPCLVERTGSFLRQLHCWSSLHC